ncbi:glycosyltransferase family 8 protein [Campylobacter sp. MIT 19-121]|nr:glycosyltransferase family 8 protein [Campylobacter sp. MIT 19-121]
MHSGDDVFYHQKHQNQQCKRGGGALTYKAFDDNLNSQEKLKYHFHILTNNFSQNTIDRFYALEKELNALYPCSIHIHQLDDSIFKDLPKLGANHTTYFRLKLVSLLDTSVKTCLYLDVDMLVLGDLRALFALDLQDKVLAAVYDERTQSKRILKSLNLEYKDIAFCKTYFNGGCMLINLEEFRKQNLEQKCLELMPNYDLKAHDQDILNALVQGQKVLKLPYEYNIFVHSYSFVRANDERKKFDVDYSRKELNFALKNPIILHFTNEHKAWFAPHNYINEKGEFLGEIWWRYALQTPIFKDELYAEYKNLQEALELQEPYTDEIAFLMIQCTKSFLGYLQMPFVIFQAIKKYEHDKTGLKKRKLEEHNLGFELRKIAFKAYWRRKEGKMLSLPYQAYRTQLRVRKYGLNKLKEE